MTVFKLASASIALDASQANAVLAASATAVSEATALEASQAKAVSKSDSASSARVFSFVIAVVKLASFATALEAS